jgi:divalent metal cation (Fe/Co/Zn/Cd) transporter
MTQYINRFLRKNTTGPLRAHPVPRMQDAQTLRPATFNAMLLKRHWRIAWWLALATIGYNLAEGLFCTVFGYHDQSTTLFGFGLDSFIECLSGLGIAHMVWRSRREAVHRRDEFERMALRVTGGAFYALAVGLLAGAAWGLYSGQKPATTFWGILVATISLSVMWAMIWQKEKTGKALQSEAMLADAQCARVCMWMSVILLVSSGLYAWTNFAYADVLGAAGLAVFSVREGKECFDKAASEKLCTCH